MNLLITICARGGSKGIPGKNIKLLNGKPLIVYTISTAQQLKTELGSVDIELSTDSDEIRAVAEHFKLKSDYQRPEALATDYAGKIDAIADLWSYAEKTNSKEYDFVLDMDVTSPLRTVDDIKEAVELLVKKPDAKNIFSVNKANRNPYFNMVENQANGYFGLIKQLPAQVKSRQAAPKVYDMNASFYIYRRSFFIEGCKSAITDKSLIYEMSHLCFDLDEPHDFDYLEYLLSKNKLPFNL